MHSLVWCFSPSGAVSVGFPPSLCLSCRAMSECAVLCRAVLSCRGVAGGVALVGCTPALHGWLQMR